MCDNILKRHKEQFGLSYRQIAEDIRKTTGREYSYRYLGNVARGTVPVTDGLMYNLTRTYPNFFAVPLPCK